MDAILSVWEQNYFPFDWELLAAFSAIRHFLYKVEGHQFSLFGYSHPSSISALDGLAAEAVGIHSVDQWPFPSS